MCKRARAHLIRREEVVDDRPEGQKLHEDSNLTDTDIVGCRDTCLGLRAGGEECSARCMSLLRLMAMVKSATKATRAAVSPQREATHCLLPTTKMLARWRGRQMPAPAR